MIVRNTHIFQNNTIMMSTTWIHGIRTMGFLKKSRIINKNTKNNNNNKNTIAHITNRASPTGNQNIYLILQHPINLPQIHQNHIWNQLCKITTILPNMTIGSKSNENECIKFKVVCLGFHGRGSIWPSTHSNP